MAKFVRFIVKDSNQIIDVPLDEGNTFPNLIMFARLQGFVLDPRLNVFLPIDSVKYAIQIEMDSGVQDMTKQ
jgi:hypothetical protein